MKFLVLLALAMQCTMAKSWHTDSFSAETSWPLGWLAYIRRILILALLILITVLYYVPQSRPHARRACFIMIDIIASTIKLALGANETDTLFEEVKSDERAGAQSSQAENGPSEITKFESADAQPRQDAAESSTGARRQRERRRTGLGSSKEEWQERDSRKIVSSHRSDVIKDASSKSKTEYLMPMSPRSEKYLDVKKYLRTRLSHTKGLDSSNLDNCIILVSGNKWQSGAIREKYTKSDLVILHDGPSKLDIKDSSTLTEDIPGKHVGHRKPQRSSKSRRSSEDERLVSKDCESGGTSERRTSKYSENKTSHYQSAEYDVSHYSRPSMRVNDAATPATAPTLTKSEKSARSKYRPRENYSPIKSHDSNDQQERNKSSSPRRRSGKNQGEEERYEKSPRRTGRSRSSSKNDHFSSACCCTGSPCCKEHAALEERETTPYRELITANYDLELDRPDGESSVFSKRLEDELFFEYELSRIPTPMSHAKPTLLRAVDWLFSSCPGAARANQQQSKVGKEENQTVTSGWLL